MRVIAGSCGGRLLRAPAGSATRPTADRVREAVFDILGSLTELEGTAVADLFAGSGAMGIEALSRGAATAVFVDTSAEALHAVGSNLESLELSDRARIVRSDVVRWLEHPHRFDLALCDPPYDFTDWDLLLGRLTATLAVLESRRPVPVPATWDIIRSRRYGGTLVCVIRSLGAEENEKKGFL